MNPLSRVRVLHPLLLLTLSFVAAACGSSTDSSNSSGTLEANRKMWNAKGLTDYRFTFNWSCFCVPEYVRPVQITVRGGEIRQIVHADDGTAVDAERWDDYSTIAGLFDLLDEAYARPAFQVNAEYNSSYGYPVNVYIDYSQQMADEEKGFRIEAFEPLP